MGITLSDCYNTAQFRRLAKARLPGPIFHYIDGAADDTTPEQMETGACPPLPPSLSTLTNPELQLQLCKICHHRPHPQQIYSVATIHVAH